MARPKNTELRRKEIVQALLTVMANHGYAKATIQAIATEAGLRPGLIHYHFKTKQEILVELIKQVHEMGVRRFEEHSANAETPMERLNAFIGAKLAKGKGEAPEAVAAWVVIGTEAIRQPEVRTEYEKSIAAQKEILETLLAAAAKRALSRNEIENLAAITLAAMEGSYQLSVTAKGIMPTGYAAESLSKLIEASL